MDSLKSANSMIQSLFKSRPLTDYVKIRNVQGSDIEVVSNLLLAGLSLHRGCIGPGIETRQEWLRRAHGENFKSSREEVRIASVGHKVVAAYALVGVASAPLESSYEPPSTLRFFTLEPEFISESLVHLLLDDAVLICQRWELGYLSADFFTASNPLIPPFEKFGFRREFGEHAEFEHLQTGLRTFLLDLSLHPGESLLAH